MSSPESKAVKEFLRRLNSESSVPLEKITDPVTPPGIGGGAMGKAVGQGNAKFAMAGLRDVIKSSQALEGLQGAVKSAKSLVLRKGSMGDKGVSALARAFEVGNPTSLQHLDLSDNAITEQGMRALSNVLGEGVLAGLEYLNLSHNLLRDDGSAMLAGVLHIGRLPTLQHLDLSHCYIGDTGVQSITDAMLSTEFSSWSLQSLDLSANVFGEDGLMAICRTIGLGRLPYLKYLNLSLNTLGQRGTLALGSLLNSGKLVGLTHLLLSRCYLSHSVEPISQAIEAGRLPNVELLDVSSNNLGDRGSVALAKALRSGNLSNLHHLTLSKCGIAPERADTLAEAMEMGKVWKIKHLDLSDNFKVASSRSSSMESDFTTSHGRRSYVNSVRIDVGSLSLSRLMKKGRLTALQHLNLSRCCMTDEGLMALADKMEMGYVPQLRRFLLTENDIRSARSIDALVRALESEQVPHLEELDLGYNSYGDDVSFALARALGNVSLEFETPLVKNFQEKLRSTQSPMESFINKVLRFVETYLGFKLRHDQSPGNGKILNQYSNDSQPRHIVKDDRVPPESTGTDPKVFFSALLVLVWFLAVVKSYL